MPNSNNDKRRHNTRILLHAMGNGLRAHIEESVTTAEDLEALELMALMHDRDPDVQVKAIIESKTRTEILLVNVERLFAAWEKSSDSGDHRRRRTIVRDWYFNKLGLSQIAKELNRTEETILTQLGIALDELSVYFFGKDGLQRVTS